LQGEVTSDAWPVRAAQLERQAELKNCVVNGALAPRKLVDALPLWGQTWLRNFLAANLIYFGVNTLWAGYIYSAAGKFYFPDARKIPSVEAMAAQARVSFLALPMYTALPTLSEDMILRGWTKVYPLVDDQGGWAKHLALFGAYMLGVEFFVYWMHRLLHDIKPGYKYLHRVHHIYNKEHTLSPFAGLAFHPIDGILQAAPYVFLLFVLPVHALSHELALFATAFWTTNIHDCIVLDVWPIMGSSYHTIHHTTYKHNYGHYTILFDWLFGTLLVPEFAKEKAEWNAARDKVAKSS
jgi:lathosterol oxidase